MRASSWAEKIFLGVVKASDKRVGEPGPITQFVVIKAAFGPPPEARYVASYNIPI